MSLAPLAAAVAELARRRFRPTREEAALRTIRVRAEQERRRTPGLLQLMDLEIEYVDALSLSLQWHDIFVRSALEFRAGVEAPRVLDCGANIGVASMWLKRAYPRARITAFEADPHISDVLRRNLSRNGFADVDVVQAAVWSNDSCVTFRAEGTDAGAIDEVAARTDGRAIQVPAIRLRDRLIGERVDFLKLDIEGAELDVLEDSVAALDHVKALHVEVHDFAARRRLLPRCLLLLERAGFTYALDEFVPATWRSEGRQVGPFARAVPAWVIVVRAWRAVGI